MNYPPIVQCEIVHGDVLFATNGLSVPTDCLTQYLCCWLAVQGVTYIECRTDESFHLMVNYPLIVQVGTLS